MPCHDVSHILEDLQILDLHLLNVIGLALIGLFQLGEVFENVSFGGFESKSKTVPPRFISGSVTGINPKMRLMENLPMVNT